MELALFDAAVRAVYEAALVRGSLADMFKAIAGIVGAGSAGVSLYDPENVAITHTIFHSLEPPSDDALRTIGSIANDPGTRPVATPVHRHPRRYTDVIPENRLRATAWFRRQELVTGIGHVMIVDRSIGGARVRLFAARRSWDVNFDQEAAAAFGMMADHMALGFANGLHRFSPAVSSPGISTVLLDEERLAEAYISDMPMSARIARRCGLTPAETRVLDVMLTGCSRLDAAQVLNVSVNSLKTHMRRIYAKTSVRRLPELLKVCQLNG